MTIKKDIKEFADIINMPRPEPKNHPRMPKEKRAAQFAPFAALTGYEEVVKKTAKQHEDSVVVWEKGEDELEFRCDDSD
ncbi:hypothetical protein SELR_13090 [Selenomonas ruminantium subsp. lactilytica TAM6421]|uniref:Uncharacterized protein n=1 Tax=Selenomonas ruminantium subsp. lactilytica (strain NBRC 103574 / TAM6421) TaxID=927704 RepID=I0GQI0_SELRL|nr:hypothetical protein [Selenomonas ruminantium]BAL83017.1 hypothetical protein SELR_13090 [Selenomonas ruminantium subsp. lactilytica TAM6421]